MRATTTAFLRRHAAAVAVTVVVVSVAGTGAALALVSVFSGTEDVGAGELIYVACQILPYGMVGAVLVARRPDLPFGWLLCLAAMCLVLMLAVAGPALAAVEHGRGGQAATWGLTAGSLLFVPAAIEGVVNVRFPSGTPAGRWGRVLRRAIVVGTLVALLGGVLGHGTIRSLAPDAPRRFIDDTPVAGLGDELAVLIPVVILLGLVAGIGVVVRWWRSEGVERLQLRWRALGALGALALFPLAVTQTLPAVVFDLAPMLFVATLVVPVLRYDLWAIDSIVRRSATHAFAGRVSAVEATVRATAEMLRLPLVQVRSGDRVITSYGSPTGAVQSWPLMHDGEHVGDLVAAPRHGLTTVTDADRRVLATLAELVGGWVRAESLTADLLDARHRLVAAREEERRRLRRDLHDGLGPLLTGLGLNLDAAVSHLGTDDARVATYLGNAQRASEQVIGGLRDLVHGLRPPALDELGLADALSLHLGPLAADAGLALDLRVRSGLALPAAVEVAAFRTVVEAVTNVARHSGASRVDVGLAELDGSVVVTVGDDGTGTVPWRPGVGLVGMRERAEELGGSLQAGPTPAGGLVRAVFPVPLASMDAGLGQVPEPARRPMSDAVPGPGDAP